MERGLAMQEASQDKASRVTMNIPEYCRLAGIGTKLGYELAKRNELPVPVIRMGRRLVLPRAAVMRLFNGA
jgi:hypothetical protein